MGDSISALSLSLPLLHCMQVLELEDGGTADVKTRLYVSASVLERPSSAASALSSLFLRTEGKKLFSLKKMNSEMGRVKAKE